MVSGQTPRPERDRLIGGLETGEVQILTSCDLISEGLDVPSVGAVSLCRPTQSLALYLQQIGRGMRPKPDGRPLIVLDHAGNVQRHGPPDQRRTWDINQMPPEPGEASHVVRGGGGRRRA
jgi:DNA repair protein RadD